MGPRRRHGGRVADDERDDDDGAGGHGLGGEVEPGGVAGEGDQEQSNELTGSITVMVLPDAKISYSVDASDAVAVADGKELIVPVLKNADQLSLMGLTTGANDLAEKARTKTLDFADIEGGTFTITNVGVFGNQFGMPIINQPQVAILSTDGVRKKPVVIEGPDGDSIGIRPVGILAQSFDHRAFDGAYSAAFLDRVRRLLETDNWFREL